jgi:hypothetical protein
VDRAHHVVESKALTVPKHLLPVTLRGDDFGLETPQHNEPSGELLREFLNRLGIGFKISPQPADREPLFLFGIVEESALAARSVFTDAESMVAGGNRGIEDFAEAACRVLAELSAVTAMKGRSPGLSNHLIPV